MGLRYLNGLSWAEVTREERVFCMHLYMALERVGAAWLIQYLNDRFEIGANAAAEWELAYEACFYRDVWHLRGRTGQLVSPKRTFDLALFSDDEIVIIEAKAQQPLDDAQVDLFVRDVEQVQRETGVERVLLVGLCSSQCTVPERIRHAFEGRVLTWRELAKALGSDRMLLRADAVYEEPSSWATGANNRSGKRTGAELVDAHRRGERFLVGRKGGLDGPLLSEDIATGRWRTQKYETNGEVAMPPNDNWFALADLVARLPRGASS
jgi:hypothetical protein